MKWINSIENPLVKTILKIKKNPVDRTLIEGLNLLKTAIEALYLQKDNPFYNIEQILVTEEFIRKEKSFFNLINRKNYLIVGISERIAEKISDTITPQGVFGVLSFQIRNLKDINVNNPEVVVILDKIQDPGNLGTIIRASEALGANFIILTPGTCNSHLTKVLRASAGSIFYIPIVKADYIEIEKFILRNNLNLIIAEPKSEKFIFDVNFSKPSVVVFGNESQGVSGDLRKIPHISCRIPHMGQSESLNVAISAAIFLYEILRSKTKKSIQSK